MDKLPKSYNTKYSTECGGVFRTLPPPSKGGLMLFPNASGVTITITFRCLEICYKSGILRGIFCIYFRHTWKCYENLTRASFFWAFYTHKNTESLSKIYIFSKTNLSRNCSTRKLIPCQKRMTSHCAIQYITVFY